MQIQRGTMQHRITKLFIFINLVTCSFLFSADAKQLQKDEKVAAQPSLAATADTAKTFKLGEPLDFTVGPHAVYIDKKNPQVFGFYIGSSEEKEGNEFAIAASFRGFDTILSTAPAKINLNLKADQVNPINGAKISLLGLISKYPVAVKAGQDNLIYIYNEGGGLLATPQLNDSNNQVSSKIIKFATADNGALTGSAIFAAVKNNKDQLFGSNGSGIAFITLENKVIQKETKRVTCQKKDCDKCIKFKKENEIVIRQVKVFNADPEDKTTKENKAAPFTGSINAIKINNNAEIISDIIDMYWDEALSRLYIALQVRSNSNANSGARAIVSCRVINGKIFFDPIVSNSAILGNDQIIGTAQSNQDVSILKVRTMHTSTLLSYLIVEGGNGAASNVANQLYALPLVDKSQEKINLALDTKHGTLAQYNQDPKEYFNNNFFVGRAFINPAATSDDLLTANNIAAKIGNGPVPLDNGKSITDMFVIGDSVYVTTADNFNLTTQPGVFYSEPIFDNLGRIAAWTNWKRFATEKKVFAGAFDVWTGQFWYLTSSASNKINILNRTDWQTDEKNEVQKTINSEFVGIGGIQGLFEFPENKLLVATGFEKVALIESQNMLNLKMFEDKTLNEVGNIVAATFVQNKNNNWLVVGGTNGLAIQYNNSFKVIGNYKFIKKLYFDGKFLYVLTDKTFDRIELTAKSIKTDKLNIVTLANIENKIFNPTVTFSDFIVSGKLALLGTSIGLFRIGNAKDVTKIKNQIDSNWVQIDVSGSVGPILKIYMLNSKYNISQLYVLSGYIGFYQSKLNRLFVDLSNNISNETIKPVNDMFIKNELSSFYDFENFKDGVLQIGSTILNFNSKDLNVDTALKSTPFLHTASRALTSNSFNYNLGITKFNQIYGILRNETTGNLVVNGDFGLIINQ